ncbi:hypothetical protein [Streptomyces tauricus]|uniref:hypothetical protein n=1 Tax=Streptomyces tauricus TaxID=68274 RepID=UPI003431BC79
MSTPEIVTPSACTWCGIERRGHGRQYADAAGWHAWERPSQEQILARMQARRLARFVAREGALPMPVGSDPKPLSDERLAQYVALVGRSTPVGAVTAAPGILAVLLEEIQRLRAEREKYVVVPRWDYELLEGQRDRATRAEQRIAELEAERHQTNEALDDAVQALRTRAPREDEADRIVAYRDPGASRVLLCREHGPLYSDLVPVTSEDLPDGGICTYGRSTDYPCNRDVLIDLPEAGGR